jgi:hypothetical protein
MAAEGALRFFLFGASVSNGAVSDRSRDFKLVTRPAE